MSSEAVLFFLCLCILFLIGVIFYQQYAFRKGIKSQLRTIHEKLKEILDTGSSQQIMVFTEEQELMELAAQINRMLEYHQKVEADHRRSEIASRRMLSNISHDMKTPMTVILGYLEIMGLHREAAPDMLWKVEQKARGMMTLINEFFTLAKIESGDTDLEISKVDICELCRECALDFYELLEKEQVQTEFGLPSESVYVQGDRKALQRIFGNLISNVIRYGLEGRYLGIFVRADQNNVYADVIDKGQGIDQFGEERVFERLFTMEDSRSRSIQGSGLGLTIARHLARQMGGDIFLDSTPHVKTTFTVRLKRF